MNKLSQVILDFSDEIGVSIPYIDTNKVALNVTNDQATSLTDFKTAFDPLIAKYKDDDQRTLTVIHDVENQYQFGHALVAAIKQQIKHDKKVTLTSEMISKIHIHVDAARRHKVPAPAFAPANKEIEQKHLVTTIWTFNPQASKEDQTHLPTDVTRVARRMAVVKQGDTPTPGQYMHLNAIGATIYNIVHSAEQKGMTAWLITNYVSPTGEEGPDSDPLSFIII